MGFLKDMGIEVKYRRLLRICNNYGFLSKIGKLGYPKGYQAKHKQELKETGTGEVDMKIFFKY